MPVTAIFILAAIVFFRDSFVFALDGQIGIHDPSTVIFCDGKFYIYGTGGMSLVSDDGWTWRRGTPLPRRGLAPDVIHLGIGLGTVEPERMRAGLHGLHDALTEAKIQHIWYESPGTDHEWQTWRRDLKDFAPRLFQ